MNKIIAAWISAMRLRTLPLALASIGMGSFLAVSNNVFNFQILIWAALTTIFLQVLSNLANDYGDTVNGADNSKRVGPERAIQSGAISIRSMKVGIAIFALLSLGSGITLLIKSIGIDRSEFYWFLGFGLASILAAYSYTAGKRPYGYAGLGDIAVLIFFGFLGVGGCYYLYALELNYLILLPSLVMGALATAVLNINNIRDIDADTLAGKQTIPVRFGRKNAVIYHWLLLLTAIIGSAIYLMFLDFELIQLIWLLGLPLILVNGYNVAVIKNNKDLDPYLKQLALSSLVFIIFFGLSIIL